MFFIEYIIVSTTCEQTKTRYFCVMIERWKCNILILILYWYRLLTNIISLISINSHENIMVSIGLNSPNLRKQYFDKILLIYDLLNGLTSTVQVLTGIRIPSYFSSTNGLYFVVSHYHMIYGTHFYGLIK